MLPTCRFQSELKVRPARKGERRVRLSCFLLEQNFSWSNGNKAANFRANFEQEERLLKGQKARRERTPFWQKVDFSSSDSTIPSHVLPTSLRPDLVLLFPNRKIDILELTIPFETNISSVRLRKSNRYASLLTDLRLSAYQAKFFSLEVGSRGFLSPSNFETLLSLSLLPSKSPVTARRLRSDLSRLATLCSYAIFRSRSDPSWLTPPLLTIPSSNQSI